MPTETATQIEALRRYILDEYDGRIDDALESIGGIKLVREALGWGSNFAVLDFRLYNAPEKEEADVN